MAEKGSSFESSSVDTLREVGSSQPVNQRATKRTLKCCPSCGEECPVARKKCPNIDCSLEFPRKLKNWDVVDKRGQTNPTHERKKLEYRADVLHNHHDYDIVVLYHRKHGRGHSTFSYATPGRAFAFLGDGTRDSPPSKEGSMFLQLFSHFMQEQRTSSSVPQASVLLDGTCVKDTVPLPLYAERSQGSMSQELQHVTPPMQSTSQSSTVPLPSQSSTVPPPSQAPHVTPAPNLPSHSQTLTDSSLKPSLCTHTSVLVQSKANTTSAVQPPCVTCTLAPSSSHLLPVPSDNILKYSQFTSIPTTVAVTIPPPTSSTPPAFSLSSYSSQMQVSSNATQSEIIPSIQQAIHTHSVSSSVKQTTCNPISHLQDCPTTSTKLHSPVIPNKNYIPSEGDKVCIYGKQDGPAKPSLIGTGIVMPGNTLHQHQIRKGCSKIVFTSLVPNSKCRSFFKDKYGEDDVALNQFYEWPNEYLWRLHL